MIREKGIFIDLSDRKIKDNHFVIDKIEMESALQYARNTEGVEFDKWYMSDSEYGILVKLTSNSRDAYIFFKANTDMYKRILLSSSIPMTDGERKIKFNLDEDILEDVGNLYLYEVDVDAKC